MIADQNAAYFLIFTITEKFKDELQTQNNKPLVTNEGELSYPVILIKIFIKV